MNSVTSALPIPESTTNFCCDGRLGNIKRFNSELGELGRIYIEDPWKDIREGKGEDTNPDLIIFSNGKLLCWDAKYKRMEENWSPSRNDQYQIFAYSHLLSYTLKDEGNKKQFTPKHVALVYPINMVEHTVSKTYSRGGESGGECTLRKILLPFPSDNDVNSEEDWESYLQNLSDIISKLIC